MNMERTKEENKQLCDRYPFIIPWNLFSGMLITEAQHGGYYPGSPTTVPDYDYEYTLLDNMPDGWNMAFGEQMCEEIREALIEDGDLNRYRVVQVKEKYGMLRWYDNGIKIHSRVHDIVRKYENISAWTCIVCGKPATRITTGWISPFCDECCLNCGDGKSVAIEDYYKELGEEDHGGSNDTGNRTDGGFHRMGEHEGSGRDQENGPGISRGNQREE